MSSPAPKGLSADRLHAAEVLLQQLRSPGRVDQWLAVGHPELNAAERRRSWALVYGVLRNRTALELRLAPYLKKPLDKQCFEVRVALLLCCYELQFMDAVPDRAAVHQAVELVRSLGQDSRTGFVNAVARRLSRDDLPVELPERSIDPSRWAEQVASHPAWLVAEMAELLGDSDAASWCDANNRQPPIYLKLREPRPAALSPDWSTDFSMAEVTLVPGAMRLAAEAGPVTALPGFDEGGFWVQDAAAQAVGMLLGLRPGMRVLDACAAPGGKTLAAAQEVGPDGMVVAVDRSKSRLALLTDSLQRLGLGNVEVQVRNLLKEPWGSRQQDECFDAVLLDAPCSGLGVIRRHPDVRWNRTPDALEQYNRTQGALLRSVAAAVAPNATLVYSVCSFHEAETDRVVAAFLDDCEERFLLTDARTVLQEPSWPLLQGKALRTYPHRHDMDAFFAVRLEAVR